MVDFWVRRTSPRVVRLVEVWLFQFKEKISGGKSLDSNYA
jgi:hypothetical protein